MKVRSMATGQPRVVVQLANGEEVPVSSSGEPNFGIVTEDQIATEQIVEEMDTDYAPMEGIDSSGEEMQSPPPQAVPTRGAPQPARGIMLATSSRVQQRGRAVRRDEEEVVDVTSADSPLQRQQSPRFTSRQAAPRGPVPPSSPSPPPSSMTPPEHHLIAVSTAALAPPGVGQVIHHHQSGPPTVRRIAPAPGAPTPTTVVLAPAGTMISVPPQQGRPSAMKTIYVTEAGAALNAHLAAPAVVVAAPAAGGSPTSDHCYGLPYQDHNYGGVSQGMVPQNASPPGNPGNHANNPVSSQASGFWTPERTIYGAGAAPRRKSAPLQSFSRQRTVTQSSDGEPIENFPVIGGLESYLEGESQMPETLPSPASQNVVAHTVGDGIAITTFRQPSNPTTTAPQGQSQQVSYYQRYITPADQAGPAPSGAYNSHLVQIGGRTYIRQTAAPPGRSNLAVFRQGGREYLGGTSGVSNPPVIVPPFQRGRIAVRRTARPTARIVRPGGGQGPGILVAPQQQFTEVAAPVIAPSRGGRPPGRSRGGTVRRPGSITGPPAVALPTGIDVSAPLAAASRSPAAPAIRAPPAPSAEGEESPAELAERAAAGYRQDYQKRYDELHNKPPAGHFGADAPVAPGAAATRTTTPRGRVAATQGGRGRKRPPVVTAGPQMRPPEPSAPAPPPPRGAQRKRPGAVRSPGTPVRVEQLPHHFGPPQMNRTFSPPAGIQENQPPAPAVMPPSRSPRRRPGSLSPFGTGVPTPVTEISGEYINSPLLPKITEDQQEMMEQEENKEQMDGGPAEARMHAFGPLGMVQPHPAHLGPMVPDQDLTESDLSESDEDSASESSSSTETDLEGEWAGTAYVTRCLCGMQHNDEFMIECDKCSVWQHCWCMGIDTKKIPDTHLCEQCNPRTIKRTPEQAKEYQEKKLKRIAKEREKRRQMKLKRREQKQKEREKRRAERLKAKLSGKTPEKAVKSKPGENYVPISDNEYTEDAKRFVQLQGDTLGHSLLEQTSDNICQAMYVGPQVMGLVTTHTVPPNQPVAEYRGRICLKSECSGKDKLGRVIPHCLMYSGFPVNQVDVSGQDTICVDARLKGSAARFVRRSCRPNTQVKHVIKDNRIHLLLVSQEFIERFNEITVPFDYDFRSSRFWIDCACVNQAPASPQKDAEGQSPGPNGEEEILCPIREHNRDLELKKKDNKKKRAVERRERKKKDVEKELKKKVAEAQKKKKTKLESKGKKKIGPPKVPATKKAGWKVKLAGKAKKKAVASGSKAKAKVKLPVKPKSKAKVEKKKEEVKKEVPVVQQSSVKKGKKKEVKEEKPVEKKPEELKKRRSSGVSEKKEEKTEKVEVEPKRKRTNVPGKSEKQSVKDLIGDVKEEQQKDEAEMNFTLPEDRNRMSREDKKLQSLLSQIQKMEEKEKKKDPQPTTPSKKKEVKTKMTRSKAAEKEKKKKAASKWKKGQEKSKKKKKVEKKKKTPVGKKGKDKKEKSDSDTSSDEESDRDDSGTGGAAGGASSTPGGGRPTPGGRSGGGSGTGAGGSSGPVTRHQPPRKRWTSSSANNDTATEASNFSSNFEESPGANSTGSPATPSTVAGKKRWLRQAIAEDKQEGAEADEVTPPLPKKAKVITSIVDEPETSGQKMESAEAKMTTAEAAELLTQFPDLISNSASVDEEQAQQAGPASPEPPPGPGVEPPDGPDLGEEGREPLANPPPAPKIIPFEPLWQQEAMVNGEEAGFERNLTGNLHLDTNLVAANMSSVYSEGTDAQVGAQGLDLVSGLTPPQQPPEPVKRRKVTLDEYKKRKGTTSADIPGSKDAPDSSAPSTSSPGQIGERGPNWNQGGGLNNPGGQSFIPSMNERELLMDTSGRIRLSSLPDPSQIGKGTATFEDLKAKIYGKKFLAENKGGESDQELPPPPPPGKPPPGKTAPKVPEVEEARISLEDRLREQFGIEPEAKETELTGMIYGPPVLGTPGTYGAAQGQGARWAGQNGRMEGKSRSRKRSRSSSSSSTSSSSGSSEESAEEGELEEKKGRRKERSRSREKDKRRNYQQERPRRPPRGEFGEGPRYPLKNRLE